MLVHTLKQTAYFISQMSSIPSSKLLLTLLLPTETYLINFIVLLFAGGKKTAAVVEGDHESSLVGGC